MNNSLKTFYGQLNNQTLIDIVNFGTKQSLKVITYKINIMFIIGL